MAYSIGRFGTDITVRNPSSVTRSGSTVTVQGHADTSSAEKRSALMQQLQGLVNNDDEPTVPFIYSQDTSKQGYVTVTAVNTQEDPTPSGVFRFSYTVTMELVAGGLSLPELELVSIGAARANKPAGVTPIYWVGLNNYTRTFSTPSGSPVPGSGGALRFLDSSPGRAVSIFTSNDLITYPVTFTVAPENYYYGACGLKMGASRLWTVGREIDDNPTAWTLTNGLVDIGPATDDTYAVNVKCRNGSGADATVTTYNLEIGYITAGPTWNTFDLGSSTVSLVMITCLRNSPEETRIMLTWGVPELVGVSTTFQRLQLTISLRRGARGAAVLWQTNGYPAASWGMGWRAQAAMSAIDADNRGLVENAADADGNKRVIIGEKAVTLGTATGRIYGGSVQSFGAWVGYSTDEANTVENADEHQDQYFAAMSSRQRVVPK